MKAILGDYIAEAVNGFASGERTEDGVIQLRMNNVSSKGSIDLSRSIRVPTSDKQRQRFLLKQGDVLFNHTNSTELVGKTALFDAYDEDVVFSNHFTRLRVKPEKADATYLSFFINHLWNRGYFRQRCQVWVGQSAVRFEVLATAPAKFPDVSTQHRVAFRLKEQMSAVEQARQSANDASKAIRPLLEKTIADSFRCIIPLSLGRDEAPAPKGWRWKSLVELARLATGHTPSRRCPEYWADGDIPWLALPDIRALDCHVATKTSEMTNALGIANSSARLLPPGTVALSRTASVGFVTLFGKEMATSQDFVNWVCGPDLYPSFLMWLLRAARVFIRGASTGAVHQTVYMNVVERFRVCLPNIAEQKKIAARLDESFRLIQQLQAAHEAQLAALDRLPGAYLREAFGNLQ
jgi:type I restriction enzyme S subunit